MTNSTGLCLVWSKSAASCLLLLFVVVLHQHHHPVSSFQIPLPGGRNIKFEDGGIIRIQLADSRTLPDPPPIGTYPSKSTLDSIVIRDTNTAKGFGAYCTKPLPKFTFIGYYEGTLMELSSSSSSSSSSLKDALLEEENGDSNNYVLSLDGGASFLNGYERAQDRTLFSPVHLNHADKNTEHCNCVRVLSERNVAFFTSRDVSNGEELCFDYGNNFWKGREREKI